jgi:hypothetical protein
MSLKFEHRRQQVATLPRFLSRMGRYMLVCTSLIAFSAALGTWGYHFFAGLAWLDSFYMACMILTGMGPVADMPNDASKWFSSLYALYSGVVFLSVTAVFLAPVVHRVLHILHVEWGEKA